MSEWRGWWGGVADGGRGMLKEHNIIMASNRASSTFPSNAKAVPACLFFHLLLVTGIEARAV